MQQHQVELLPRLKSGLFGSRLKCEVEKNPPFMEKCTSILTDIFTLNTFWNMLISVNPWWGFFFFFLPLQCFAFFWCLFSKFQECGHPITPRWTFTIITGRSFKLYLNFILFPTRDWYEKEWDTSGTNYQIMIFPPYKCLKRTQIHTGLVEVLLAACGLPCRTGAQCFL